MIFSSTKFLLSVFQLTVFVGFISTCRSFEKKHKIALISKHKKEALFLRNTKWWCVTILPRHQHHAWAHAPTLLQFRAAVVSCTFNPIFNSQTQFPTANQITLSRQNRHKPPKGSELICGWHVGKLITFPRWTIFVFIVCYFFFHCTLESTHTRTYTQWRRKSEAGRIG